MMKALILNSGLGKRLGEETKSHPKCMTQIGESETIVSRQLKQLLKCGVKEVVMTTGLFEGKLVEHCEQLDLPIQYTFINNPLYEKTNYIYSIYCAREALKNEDIILMHGDLVFSQECLLKLLSQESSCMIVSSTINLPEKDFKAVVEGDRIRAIGIDFFNNAVAAQPLYKIEKDMWNIWLENIEKFCENGITSCYAENAFNEISDNCILKVLDIKDMFCKEIDTKEDLDAVQEQLREVQYSEN